MYINMELDGEEFSTTQSEGKAECLSTKLDLPSAPKDDELQ